MVSVGDVEMWLGTYASMLTFEEVDKYIVAKPRQYLGSENFAKIASLFRQHNGEYISAGKESHFRVATETSNEVKVAGVMYCPYCGKAVKLEKA